MAEITDLNITDASNTARMPENQSPSSVNDGVRALEGLLARGFKDALEGDKDSTGSANAYLVAANRTISAYYDGMRQGFHASFANTGAATLDIDSVGAKTIKKNHDVDLASGDIEANQYVEVVYSATDDTFQMLSPVANAPSTLDNVVEDTTPQLGGPLDTNGQAINESEGSVASGTTTNIWLTTANTVHVTGTTTITSFGTAPRVGAWRKVIFDGALTLTDGANLNLPGGANITTAADDFAFVYAETTTLFKVLYFKADGTAVVVGSGLPTPDFTSAEQTVALDTLLDVAHSLGAVPTLWQIVMRCKTANLNYAVGDEVVPHLYHDGNTDANVVFSVDATNMTVVSGGIMTLLDQSSKNAANITVGSWKWVMRAWS